MEQLPSGWIWIIGLFTPLLAQVVLKKSWDGRLKQLIAMALSIALALLVMWIDGSLATLPRENLALVLASVFGEAELLYTQVWAPYLLTTPLEKEANHELKQVLYVQKAKPVITAASEPGLGGTDSKHSV